jgi:curved DNA-binding protein CbpA
VDPYETLQVIRTADAEVIRAAYRALARGNHPDHGGSPARMSEINDAWSILGDPVRRARYDRQQRQARARAAAEAAARAATETVRSQPMPVMRPDPVPPRRPGPAPAASPAWSAAPPSTRAPGASRGDGTVLDFGRYVGWSITELGRHDPDYLLWLERTPAGRGYRGEIQRTLEQRQPAMAGMAAGRATAGGPVRQKRSWFR